MHLPADASCAQPDRCIYRATSRIYCVTISKHLVDIDDGALGEARAQLKTSTIKDTVNEALRRAGRERSRRVKRAFQVLAKVELLDREQAWR